MEDAHIASRARGAASIRIYGNASREGAAAANARLACRRAERVAADLAADSTVTATVILVGHGATTEFSGGRDTEGPGSTPSERLRAFNRNVEMVFEPRTTPSTQEVDTPPTPAATPHVCGPDIDAQLTAVLADAKAYFLPLSPHRKNLHCRWLVVPPMAIMAWDTHQLFLPETGWLRSAPYGGVCGQPSATSSVEDPATCSNTVRVGGKCNLAGTANYATAGVLWRLCSDFYASEPWWRYADLLGDFTERGMVDYIELWKMVDWDDANPPTSFATATYRGGPAARPATENRAHCTGHCPVSGGVPAFTFRWNPYHS